MQRTDKWLPEVGGGGKLVKCVKVVRGYKLLVIKCMSPGDVIYSMVAIVNDKYFVLESC